MKMEKNELTPSTKKDISDDKNMLKSERITNEIRALGYKGDILLKGSHVEHILGISHNTFVKLKSSGEITTLRHFEGCNRYSSKQVSEYIEKLMLESKQNVINSNDKEYSTEYNREEVDVLHSICAEFPDGI